jgi:hypothetical protein
MDVEEAVPDYLFEYGDTKASDLLCYVRNEFGYSLRGAKKLIARLEKKGKIFRIVHSKLRPPGVYYSAKEHIPNEILKEMIRANAKVQSAEAEALGKSERL